jgi:hypothetical protein
MSEDKVIVRLELDSSSVDASLDFVSKKSQQSFEGDGPKSMSDAILSLNKSIENLNKSILSTETSTKQLKDNISGIGQTKGILDSVANGFKNLLGVGSAVLIGTGLLPFINGEGVSGAKQAYRDLFSAIGSGLKAVATVSKDFLSGLISGLSSGGLGKAVSSDLNLLTDAAFKGSKSLFGIAEASLLASSKLTALAVAVNLLEGPFDSLLGTTLSFAAAISTLASVVLVGVIFKFAELTKSVGEKLTASFQSAYQEFLLFRKETVAFNETIKAFSLATDGASGSTEDWAKQINVLSTELNFSQRELKKTVTELVSVGTRLGLNRDQTEQLLRVTAEYARISGKDLFDTAVAFSSALQGNSQAVLSYGVKLSEASNAQFALKNGIQETFGQLNEYDKTQVRFNNLISQYNVVQGIATTLSNDWFQQNKKLEISLDKLRTQVGLGAANVEDFNLVAGILNKIVSVIPDSLARLTGLFGALAGRLLQIIGLLVEVSFKVFLVYKGFLLLDALLKTQTFTNFATKTLPFLNTSLNQTAKNLGSVTANFQGVSAAGKTIGEILKAQKGNILQFIFGVSAAGTAGVSIFQLIFQRIGGALTFVLTAARTVLIIFAPIAAKILLIAGAITILVMAFKEIEESTQVFSSIGVALKDTVFGLAEGFSVLAEAMSGVGSFVLSVLNKAFGVVVFTISKGLEIILKVSQDIAFVFGSSLPASVQQSIAKMEALNTQLVASNFSLTELQDRGLAGIKLKTEFKDFEKLNEIIKELSGERESGAAKVAKEYQDRLSVLNAAITGEALAVARGQELINQARLSAQKKGLEALRSELGFGEMLTDQLIVNAYNNRQLKINEALNLGLINQQTFTSLSLQNMAEYHKQMDDMAKMSAATQKSELDMVMEAYNLTAEQASLAMNIAAAESDAKTKLITATFETLGASIVNGAGAWGDFKSIVFNILGDFAIQVGVLVLGIGKAVSALAASLSSLNPASAFIAGASLIVIGGLLKALAKARPGSTGPVGTAGGAIGPATPLPGAQPNQDFNPRPEAERNAVNPSVVINVEGSIFSTEQTGRTLIDMISKEFDKTGAQVRRRGFV